jgi:gas vesicle protein
MEDEMEAEITNEKKSGKNNGSVAPIITASVVGLAAGAVLGVLFAPKAGKETRAELAAKTKELSQKGKEAGEVLTSKAKAIGESTKETAEIVAGKIKSVTSHKSS